MKPFMEDTQFFCFLLLIVSHFHPTLCFNKMDDNSIEEMDPSDFFYDYPYSLMLMFLNGNESAATLPFN